LAFSYFSLGPQLAQQSEEPSEDWR
jgi:hypothetical protein